MTTPTTTRQRGGHDPNPISPQEVKVDLNQILRRATVTVTQYGYSVDLGPTVKPRRHQVGKDQVCTCQAGANCAAVSVVKDYLRKHSPRKAETPQSDFKATVSVSNYGYTVDFGPEVQPRFHSVGKDKRCACSSGANCPAVDVVADYLRAGGQRAPEPPHGYLLYAPAVCPVCGARAYDDPALSSRVRGAGWGCSKEGSHHYWQWRTSVLREAMAANPWRFPPSVIRDGKQIFAWDGIQEGDAVLYAGLLRADLITDGPIGYLE